MTTRVIVGSPSSSAPRTIHSSSSLNQATGQVAAAIVNNPLAAHLSSSAAATSSWLSSHPANLSQKSTSNINHAANNANDGPYNPVLTTQYGNFSSPLSRLSLFSGMAAGMHAAGSATIGNNINGQNCNNDHQTLSSSSNNNGKKFRHNNQRNNRQRRLQQT